MGTDAKRAAGQSLSPREKAESVRISLRRKIELLGTWLSDGLPPGQSWKTTVQEVAEWDDPLLGVTKWKSPNITAPSGKNPVEAAALKALLNAINSPPAPSVAEENRELKETVKALSGQVARLARELRIAHRDIRIGQHTKNLETGLPGSSDEQ